MMETDSAITPSHHHWGKKKLKKKYFYWDRTVPLSMHCATADLVIGNELQYHTQLFGVTTSYTVMANYGQEIILEGVKKHMCTDK